ncbi:MAG: diguanylate cyclase [bacterium]
MKPPRKYSFIPETLIGFAILVGINFAIDRNISGFIGIHPHPYWIVVLLMASRYGTLPGVFAGLLAATFYIFFGTQAELLNLERSHFPLGAYRMPFFFILTGGILGEIRNLYKNRYNSLETQHHETLDELQDLGLLHAAVLESKQELEKRVAFQSTTLFSLLERLNNLETLEPHSLYAKIPELLKELLNVSCSSVYLVDKNQLVLFKRDGEPNKNQPENIVGIAEGIMGEAIRSRSVVSVNERFSEKDLVHFYKLGVIMSAPILVKDESVLGVINIEQMPFFDYHSNSRRVFQMLTYWVSIVIDKAIRFQFLKDRNIADEITGAYNYPYFQKRLEYEIARARRFKSPLSIFLLQIDRFEEMSPSEQKNVLVVLNWIFSNLLREVDIISKFKKESSFAVILPGQGNQTTETVLTRLLEEIEKYGLKPFDESEEPLSLKIGSSTLQISEGSYQSLIETAEDRLKYGESRRPSQIYSDIQYLADLINPEAKEKADEQSDSDLVTSSKEEAS